MPAATPHWPHADLDRDHYRPVSGWAIAALALGALSVVSLGGPVLWLVPVAGIVVAAVAMRKIGASDGELIGRNVALLGFLLAVLFGVAAVTRTYSRQYWLEHRAELFARRFIELLQEKKSYAAHQLTVEPGVRKPLAAAEAEAYANDPESRKTYQEFLEREPAKTLLEHGRGATAEPADVRLMGHDGIGDFVSVVYRITSPGGDAKKTIAAKLVLLRIYVPTSGLELWQISSTSVE